MSGPMSDPVHGLRANDPRLPLREWAYEAPRYGEHFRRCNYCGSIAPDDLAVEIQRGGIHPEWADQKYGWPHKLYVEIPGRDDRLHVLGATSRLREGDTDYVPVAQVTEEQRAAVEQGGWGPDWATRYEGLSFGPRPTHHGKFYSVHLADPALDPSVKQAIEAWSGRSFAFTGDGRVSWHRA